MDQDDLVRAGVGGSLRGGVTGAVAAAPSAAAAPTAAAPTAAPTAAAHTVRPLQGLVVAARAAAVAGGTYAAPRHLRELFVSTLVIKVINIFMPPVITVELVDDNRCLPLFRCGNPPARDHAVTAAAASGARQ